MLALPENNRLVCPWSRLTELSTEKAEGYLRRCKLHSLGLEACVGSTSAGSEKMTSY